MEIPSGHTRDTWLLCHAWDSPIIRASDASADNDNALSLCRHSESPGAIFTEISQWRWCYVTAAVDPAVHITNASHCGGVTCFIQATFRRQQQQQQCSSCYYSRASVTQDHAELRSHCYTLHWTAMFSTSVLFLSLSLASLALRTHSNLAILFSKGLGQHNEWKSQFLISAITWTWLTADWQCFL